MMVLMRARADSDRQQGGSVINRDSERERERARESERERERARGYMCHREKMHMVWGEEDSVRHDSYTNKRHDSYTHKRHDS